MQLRVPATAIGRIGTPRLDGELERAVLERQQLVRRASACLRERSSRSTLAARAGRGSSASALTTLSRLPRMIGMSLAMRIIQPMTGILKIVSFDSHFISHGKWLDEEDVGVRLVIRLRSSGGPAGSRWSIGYSAVAVAPGPGGGQRGPDGGTFTASVTVADAASAQAAYGVAVTFSLPPHLPFQPSTSPEPPAGPATSAG